MKIVFLARFHKDLDKIGEKYVKEKLIRVIEEFESTENLRDIRNIKKLAGDKISYRIRLGDYRIGIYCENGIAEFARIVHRKEIYKVFP